MEGCGEARSSQASDKVLGLAKEARQGVEQAGRVFVGAADGKLLHRGGQFQGGEALLGVEQAFPQGCQRLPHGGGLGREGRGSLLDRSGGGPSGLRPVFTDGGGHAGESGRLPAGLGGDL